MNDCKLQGQVVQILKPNSKDIAQFILMNRTVWFNKTHKFEAYICCIGDAIGFFNNRIKEKQFVQIEGIALDSSTSRPLYVARRVEVIQIEASIPIQFDNESNES